MKTQYHEAYNSMNNSVHNMFILNAQQQDH